MYRFSRRTSHTIRMIGCALYLCSLLEIVLGRLLTLYSFSRRTSRTIRMIRPALDPSLDTRDTRVASKFCPPPDSPSSWQGRKRRKRRRKEGRRREGEGVRGKGLNDYSTLFSVTLIPGTVTHTVTCLIVFIGL